VGVEATGDVARVRNLGVVLAQDGTYDLTNFRFAGALFAAHDQRRAAFPSRVLNKVCEPSDNPFVVRLVAATNIEVQVLKKLFADGEMLVTAHDDNVTDPAAARDMLEKLPLGQAHLMSFELIPIGPLKQLRQLQGMKANP
jgi:hypothetical protein